MTSLPMHFEMEIMEWKIKRKMGERTENAYGCVWPPTESVLGGNESDLVMLELATQTVLEVLKLCVDTVRP